MTTAPRTGPSRLPPEISVNLDGCEGDDLSFCGGVLATVAGDVAWDDFVRIAVDNDWVGVEALSGIPGTVADVVSRNAPAYGQRVSDTVASVRTWDRADGVQRTFAAVDCGFAEHVSRFSAEPDSRTSRFDVLDVSFLMRQGDLTLSIGDPGLAALIGVPPATRVPIAQVRAAILAAHPGSSVRQSPDLPRSAPEPPA